MLKSPSVSIQKYLHTYILCNVSKTDQLEIEMCFREIIRMWLKNICYIYDHAYSHIYRNFWFKNKHQWMYYKKGCRLKQLKSDFSKKKAVLVWIMFLIPDISTLCGNILLSSDAYRGINNFAFHIAQYHICFMKFVPFLIIPILFLV